MNEDPSYTIRQAAEMMDETIQRIGYWIVSGVFTPADPSSGTGSSRRLSFQNLLEIKIASHLSQTGFHLHVIKSVLETVRQEANQIFTLPIATEDIRKQLILCIRTLSRRSAITNILEFQQVVEMLQDLITRGISLILIDLDDLKNELMSRINA
jgi:DNA-binding transcriptional MerR regulator